MRTRALVGISASALLLAGCTSANDADAPDPTAAPTETVTETATETTPPADPNDLPGEPSFFGPEEGAELAIVGVDHEGSAPLFARPGADSLAEIDPLATGLIATGVNRTLDDGSTWFGIVDPSDDSREGWIAAQELAYLGSTDDVTSEVIADIGRIEGNDITEIGESVADVYTSEEPPSRVVQTAPGTTGDLHEVTFDVIGLGDDSVLGYRLVVFGMEEAGTLALRTVERTVLCARGVTNDGLCV
ncbi:hypothetical protein GCM10011410_06500 [Hoyosella rhizosphaerae]|uniref:SH3 domain-containing protein n=2 Tax=Hoyosella rhizosphaerae TaxID=1755582 RepID=A0A916XAA8_9ACTN|nr:hypothetical protein GCM10011410_06500 [Hoyosella rhizosphaerae]